MKKKKMQFRLFFAWLLTAVLLLGGCGADQETVSDPLQEALVEQGTQEGQNVPEGESGRETSEGDAASAMAQIGEKEPGEVPYTEPEITLVMVGDVLMHMRVTNSGKQADGTYNYDHLFAPTKELVEAADLALVNQEVILGGPELGYSGYPRFNAPYEVADALVSAGFDVILHATNHTLDKGKTGVLNSLNYWRENYPETAVIGMQDSQEAQDQIYVYEKDGIRIAILNYTYGTNGLPLPKDMPYIVNLLNEERIASDVARAKEQADFVIVCPHWGTEYIHKASKAQKQWTQFFLECGVDLCIGTHPHVIEPVEWVEDEAGHRMLVYYSLGNYVNSTASEGEGVGNRMVGAMATVTIARNGDGEVYIREYGAEPLVTYVSGNGKFISTYPMDQFTEEMAAESSTRKKDRTFTLAHCQKLWKDVMGDLAEEKPGDAEEGTGEAGSDGTMAQDGQPGDAAE